MHYDVTSCAVICISNNVEYLEKELGSYKNSKFPDQCHSIANTSKFTQQCNVVPYCYMQFTGCDLPVQRFHLPENAIDWLR